MELVTLREYETLSPFEIKDFLAKAALKTARASFMAYLNAGQGNPNWIATTPREAFFLLGQFALTESKRVLDLPAGVGGMPKAAGIAGRLEAWLGAHRDMPGAPFLEFWMRKYVGEEVVNRVKANVHPLDIVFRLAEDHGIVLLNGGGFDAPDWPVRVSFANLNDDVYDDIGRAVRAVARGYYQAYQIATGKTGGARASAGKSAKGAKTKPGR